MLHKYAHGSVVVVEVRPVLLRPELRLPLLVHAQRHVRIGGQVPVELPAHVVWVAVERHGPEESLLPVRVVLQQPHRSFLLIVRRVGCDSGVGVGVAPGGMGEGVKRDT